MDLDGLPWPMQVVLVFGWIFTVTVWLWSWLSLSFVWGTVGWMYDFNVGSSVYLKYIEIAWCWPAIAVCYLMYVGIVIHLMLSKKQIGNKSRKHEMAIFCQSTCVNGWMVGLMVTWHNSRQFEGKS